MGFGATMLPCGRSVEYRGARYRRKQQRQRSPPAVLRLTPDGQICIAPGPARRGIRLESSSPVDGQMGPGAAEPQVAACPSKVQRAHLKFKPEQFECEPSSPPAAHSTYMYR